jgi:beta-glucosidase
LKSSRATPVAAYRDASVPIDQRIEDLLGRMTLEEKAGLMFHPAIFIEADGAIAGGTEEAIVGQHLNHFNIYAAPLPRQHAEWHNVLQDIAASTRLGIPVTISSDPRHSYGEGSGASGSSDGLSSWPEPIGFAAVGDVAAVEEFGDIARREYRAVGIHVALHPMADLATEPRWARIAHTFGEDEALAARLVGGYVRGFQGEVIGPHSVACMTKHFPGGGPQQDGEDPHFPYGKNQVYPGGMFDYHLRVFEAAFAAGTAQVMPYYGRPVDTPYEAVGFGYNRDVITGLLRERYGFDGVVCTDWGLVTDMTLPDGSVWDAKAWGVERLSQDERVAKILDAGCDQLGGERSPEVVVALVQDGRVAQERVDVSARRLLRDKFRLGLFDEPRVDPGAAERICGSAPFRAAGERMQRRSAVILKNDGVLPLAEGANVQVLRRTAPYEERTSNFIERLFHAGDLDFKEPELSELLTLARAEPTVLVLHLDRPAVIPELADACAGVIAVFGASDEAVDDVLCGRVKAEGRLPFELPRSMAAVRAQLPDVPHDSEDPLFPIGFGLEF